MGKQIIIIGAGVSGLTALYYLRQKYADRTDVNIRLFEKESFAGGTIKTAARALARYETGPNGFLDNKPTTLELARQLGLDDQLIAASPATKIRFICSQNVLYPLPSGIASFLKFKPLKLFDKMRIAQEIFIPKGQNTLETVYEFGARRLGKSFAQYFLDPMVSGIFGGDARDLNLRYAFPRIYQIEQEHGSLFKGMLALSFKKRRQRGKNSLTRGQPTGQLWSFKNGMGQLTDKLFEVNKEFIQTQTAALQVLEHPEGYGVKTGTAQYFADELILATPAFAGADLLKSVNQSLAQELQKIPYASICVVGLVYDQKQFEHLPQGFGYLRPTFERQEVLGVLFSSNIFSNRCADGNILFQIMLGGACNPDTVKKSDEEIFSLAQKEISGILGASQEPVEKFLQRWGKAIPQYNREYPQTYSAIKKILRSMPHLHLLANYLDGVSLNDCVANAKAFAERLDI